VARIEDRASDLFARVVDNDIQNYLQQQFEDSELDDLQTLVKDWGQELEASAKLDAEAERAAEVARAQLKREHLLHAQQKQADRALDLAVKSGIEGQIAAARHGQHVAVPAGVRVAAPEIRGNGLDLSTLRIELERADDDSEALARASDRALGAVRLGGEVASDVYSATSSTLVALRMGFIPHPSDLAVLAQHHGADVEADEFAALATELTKSEENASFKLPELQGAAGAQRIDVLKKLTDKISGLGADGLSWLIRPEPNLPRPASLPLRRPPGVDEAVAQFARPPVN
jgi:hypothetical protein